MNEKKSQNKTLLAPKSIYCEWRNKKIKVCFAKLRDDLILLKITNFYKCLGNLANKIAKYSQIGTSKRQGGIKRGIRQDTNLCCQTATYIWNHFSAYGLPIQAKRCEHQPRSQSGSL